ncbi:MAG: ExeA family protein [Planctomycetota bacterium]|jgi:type II secretory pathway predicted ATPase ExeA
MYEDFFGLSRKPFCASPDPSMYVPSAPSEMAFKRLTYAVSENIGGFLLTGPAGCGKTLLLEKLAQTRAAAQEFLFIRAGRMDGDGMSAALLRAAGLHDVGGNGAVADRNAALEKLGEHFAVGAKSGRRITIMIDGAEWVDNDGLSVLEMLNDLRRNGAFLATFVLAGRDSTAKRILALAGLRDRIALSGRVDPLDDQAGAAYVRGRLAAAGADREIFSEEALVETFIFSKGVPRRINRVADLALLTAFGLEKTEVDAEVMAAVIEEMAQNPL